MNVRLGVHQEVLLRVYCSPPRPKTTRTNIQPGIRPKGMMFGRLRAEGKGREGATRRHYFGGKGRRHKRKGEGERRQLELEDSEACGVQEEEDETKKEIVEIVQEDPWTGKWMGFKVLREYAEKGKRKFYRKPSYWG